MPTRITLRRFSSSNRDIQPSVLNPCRYCDGLLVAGFSHELLVWCYALRLPSKEVRQDIAERMRLGVRCPFRITKHGDAQQLHAKLTHQSLSFKLAESKPPGRHGQPGSTQTPRTPTGTPETAAEYPLARRIRDWRQPQRHALYARHRLQIHEPEGRDHFVGSRSPTRGIRAGFRVLNFSWKCPRALRGQNTQPRKRQSPWTDVNL